MPSPSKIFSVTNAQDSLGVIVTAGSKVYLLLSQNTTTGVVPLTQTPIVIDLDDTGSGSDAVWFNDELYPPGTFYNITIVTPNYGVVYNQNVTLSGASYDLASFVPGSVGTAADVTIPTLKTNGTANTVQSLLNLKNGTGITLTADSSGGVTIDGSATGVTSVGLTDSTGLFTVTGSPVTSTGTLNLSAFASQTQATFLAGPPFADGAAAFRTIHAMDVPTLNQNTLGSSGSCIGNSATVTGLSVVSGKTLTVDNSITLAGTDATTMTFPSTSATIARTDAANTFTGHQTIEGVTSTGATGTGNLVFATSPTLVTPALGTPASGTLTNCSGLPAANIVAGTMASGMVLVAPALGTPASGTLTNCTFPTLNQNTSGTAANLSGTPALPNGTTATTQAVHDKSTKLATTAYVDAAAVPNPAICVIIDDFVGGNATTGIIGQNGWFVDTIGSTPTLLGTTGSNPNIGIITFNTASGATAGQGGGMRLISLASSSGTIISNLQGTTGWEIQWIFKLSQTADTRFRVGIDSGDTIMAGSTGLHLRYDTNVTYGDTTFVFESMNGGAVTSVDSTIAVDTNWHRVKITSTVVGTATFSLYDSTGTLQISKDVTNTITTGLGLTPIVIIGTNATAQKTVQLDYFSLYASGLAR